MAKVLCEGLGKEDSKNGSSERIAYAKQFDWQKNAKQYLELYKKILADAC